jgi:hypothetical protein
MAVSIDFTPGRTIRWHKRRFVVVDHTGFDAILAREVGKRRIERLPVREVKPDHAVNKRAASSVNLVSIPEQDWRTAVKQFALLKPLLEMDSKKRTRAHVEKLAKVLRKHPATIYRWIEAYNDSRRVSAFLRKSRSDQGGSRLPKGVDEGSCGPFSFARGIHVVLHATDPINSPERIVIWKGIYCVNASTHSPIIADAQRFQTPHVIVLFNLRSQIM